MKTLFVASEMYPLIKTGGLADVVGALPVALKQAGVDVRVLLPSYGDIRSQLRQRCAGPDLGNPFGFGHMSICKGKLPDTQIEVWLLECDELFQRSGGPYQDEEGLDYTDNAQRFACLSWAAAILGAHGGLFGWQADVIHAHDWQAGLIPAYFASWGLTNRPRVVFTIHNIQYHGTFEGHQYAGLGLKENLYQCDGLEYYGKFSMLKAGIYYSDEITTVSPSYAQEIQTEQFGCGFHGLLADKAEKITGILNGVDYGIWNPSSDKKITRKYDATSLKSKDLNKSSLQRKAKLSAQIKAPLFGVVSRLTDQKGLDLVVESMPGILSQGAQLVVLGTGDKKLENQFLDLSKSYPKQVSVSLMYDEKYAHKIIAGADCLLIPSRFEPCGLTQLYAMKYGTVPLVRRTGGLADSVKDPSVDEFVNHQNGFVFLKPDVSDLQKCLGRVMEAYKNKTHWESIQQQAMSEDFGWLKSAMGYQTIYQQEEA